MPYQPVEPTDIPQDPSERFKVDEVKLPNGHVYDLKDSEARDWVNYLNDGSANSSYDPSEHEYPLRKKADEFDASLQGHPIAPTIDDSDTDSRLVRQIVNREYLLNQGFSRITNIVDGVPEGSIAGINANKRTDGTYIVGESAFALGRELSASGSYSFAEGWKTLSSGTASHSEGLSSQSTAIASHAEGWQTSATGAGSHSEGNATAAAGRSSHAEGVGTISNMRAQHVFGEYNINENGDSGERGTYVEIVGNGTFDNRSNARTLDWSGNETLSGKLTVGSDGQDDMDVTTLRQVRSMISGSAVITDDFLRKFGEPWQRTMIDNIIFSDHNGPFTGIEFRDRDTDLDKTQQIFFGMGPHDVNNDKIYSRIVLATDDPDSRQVYLSGLRDPIYPDDAATKNYVDYKPRLTRIGLSGLPLSFSVSGMEDGEYNKIVYLDGVISLSKGPRDGQLYYNYHSPDRSHIDSTLLEVVPMYYASYVEVYNAVRYGTSESYDFGVHEYVPEPIN